jgi:predicted amidohydrolase
MNVTICELSDDEDMFLADWNELKHHVSQEKPDLVLLPELPFSRWIAQEKMVSTASRDLCVAKHEEWMVEIGRLQTQRVVYSKPVLRDGKLFNTAFLYERGVGHRKIHSKSRFPEEPDFWEETWFDREPAEAFELIESQGAKIGVLLCTEMWFTELAREYGKQGMDILLCPRATQSASVDKWIRCGQTLSVISGAYCLSSNRSGDGERGVKWGGNGWIAEPVTGDLVALTNSKKKVVTRKIDLGKCRNAKALYPQYVRE